MIPESMGLGMFQAEAGRGNTASVKSTRGTISDTVASYAISDEEGARRSGQLAMKRSKQSRYGEESHRRFTGRFSSRFSPSHGGAAAEESLPDRIPNWCVPFFSVGPQRGIPAGSARTRLRRRKKYCHLRAIFGGEKRSPARVRG